MLSLYYTERKRKMRVFKHNFEEPNIALVNGELIETDPTIHAAYFSLTTKSLELFEETYGQPLLAAIVKLMPKSKGEDTSTMIDTKLVRTLAACCYMKIDNGKVYVNESSREAFLNSPLNELCLTDIDFVNEIMSLAMDCLYQDKKIDKKGQRDKKK